MTVTRLDTYADLLAASGRHPVVELDVGPAMTPPAWAATVGDATAVMFPRRTDHGIPGAAVLGDAAAVEALVTDARVVEWFLSGDFRHLGRPRALHDLVERHLPIGSEGGDWEWMWTTTAPPVLAGEDRVVDLAPTDRDELVDLLERSSPRTHGRPFAGAGQRWVGVHVDGRVVATGCAAPTAAGVPVLSGIAVDPAHRRSGLGAAVTAALTRDAVATHGACVLGMFSDNDGARRLYHGLGFTTAVEWRSRWREVPAAAAAEQQVGVPIVEGRTPTTEGER